MEWEVILFAPFGPVSRRWKLSEQVLKAGMDLSYAPGYLLSLGDISVSYEVF